MAKIGNFDTEGMFDNLKSRLGLGESSRNRDEDYDDFDDDGYEEGYDDKEYDEWSDYAPEDAARPGAYRPLGSRSPLTVDPPRLVSMQDVKRNTPLPDRYDNTAYGSRSALDETVPPVDSSAYGTASRRAEGVDALFQPTGPISPVSSASSYDPYDAFLPSNSYTTSRSMTVIKPVSYSDAERVSKSVKSGDVVVLVMRNTPEDLLQRILDFSFGVASALDANVESPGEKVFAIARGAALTEDEKQRLRNQGAL